MLINHEGDFEVLAVGLKALLAFLSPEFQEKRSMLLKLAEAKWRSMSKEGQDEWTTRLDNTHLALVTGAFKMDAKLLEVIDSLLEGPPRSDQTGALSTLGDLMGMAHDMWLPFSDLKSPSDLQLAEEAARRSIVNNSTFKILLYSHEWTRAGFPVVKISPKFAAAAMCTTLKPEVLTDLRSPWRAFTIMLPKEPVLYHYPVDEPLPVKYLQVLWSDRSDGRHWTFWLTTRLEIPSTERHNVTSSEIGTEFASSEDAMPWPVIENRDVKALMLGGRIVCSTICALTNLDMKTEVNRPRHKQWRDHPVPSRRTPEGSQALVFQITAPVKIDLVDRVVDYQLKRSTDKAWKLNLRMVVGGHWKMQVCGQGRVERKKIWVQPYERGPKGAPLAVREHVIVDE